MTVDNLARVAGDVDRVRPARTTATPTRTTADVAIVGLGYVGLPTALAFHAAGHRVLGVDVSTARLADIRAGRVDLLPSDHDRLAGTGSDPARWELTDRAEAVSRAAAVIICVPTPVDEHLVPDLTVLRAACADVVANVVAGQVVVLTSTTYVGSTDELIVRPLRARGLAVGTDVAVAFSPERIDPGNDRHAHENVPRVVGGVTASCAERAAALLSGYARHVHRVSSPEVAEMTKLVENTFRAVNIALANELADVSSLLDLDVTEVIGAAATKPYGFMPFFPGPGVGGHCIPCDPHYLLWQLRGRRHTAPVIEQAMAGIASRPRRVVTRAREVLAEAGKSLVDARILVLGVAYKPDVEDVRESPAIEILSELSGLGAYVAYHDPLVDRVPLRRGPVLVSVADPKAFAPDLVVLHTSHAGVDTAWLSDVRLVLDATYRAHDVPHRAVV